MFCGFDTVGEDPPYGKEVAGGDALPPDSVRKGGGLIIIIIIIISCIVSLSLLSSLEGLRPATPMAAAAPAEPAERAEPASYPVSREPSPRRPRMKNMFFVCLYVWGMKQYYIIFIIFKTLNSNILFRTAEPASYPVSREQSPCAARRPSPAEAAPAPGRADRAEDGATPEVPPTASQGSAAEEDAPGGEREDGAAQMAVPTVPDKGSLAQWAPLPTPDRRIPTTVPVSKASAVGALPEDPAQSSKESVAPAVANPAEGNGCSEAGADEAYVKAERAAEAVNISAQPNAVTEDYYYHCYYYYCY